MAVLVNTQLDRYSTTAHIYVEELVYRALCSHPAWLALHYFSNYWGSQIPMLSQ